MAGGVLRRGARRVSRHPQLAGMAARVFAAFPALKPRLRRFVLQPDEATARGALNDAQIRVLLDLREATRRHGTGEP
jgi:predicted ester cyclase